jgi:pyridoxal phosphate-dependent aminotransferase EpsN
VGPGDTVFCSSFTFIGSANPILYQGARPVFIDSEPESWNLSPAALERALERADREGRLPKALVTVNLYGQSADYDPLIEACERYGVPIIEDAAESLGSTYKGRASGSLGRFGVFSFNGNKIITTSGGGMLVSNDLEALEKARFWATQARDPAPHYQHSEIGYNYRLSGVLAAIGRGQLRVLKDRVRARRAIFDRYVAALSDVDGLAFLPEASFGTSNRWLTTLTLDPERCAVTPTDLIGALSERNIEARPLWKPLHAQPLFEGAEYHPYADGQSVSDDLFRRGLCLPSGSAMTEEDQSRVIDCLRERLARG